MVRFFFIGDTSLSVYLSPLGTEAVRGGKDLN